MDKSETDGGRATILACVMRGPSQARPSPMLRTPDGRRARISLPIEDTDRFWQFLEEVDSADDVHYERKKARVKTMLEWIGDDEIWNEIRPRRREGPQQSKSFRGAWPRLASRSSTGVRNKDQEEGQSESGNVSFDCRSEPQKRYEIAESPVFVVMGSRLNRAIEI